MPKAAAQTLSIESIPLDDAKVYASRVQRDPAWFCREVLGSDPYDRQIEMIESVRDNEQTSVVGANGVGKDWMMGRIICWWQTSRYPAKTIITGPTARQVSDIVWREARGAYYSSKVPLGGRMMPVESRWEVDDESFALGFSTDKPFNLTGFHSPNLLVVITEAHNFNDNHFVQLKRLLPKRLVMTGNPFSESGEFFDSHHDKRHLYNAISISAWDSPNVKNNNEDVPGLVSLRDIHKMRDEWGEESALYKATVDCEFSASAGGLIPLAWLLRAREDATEDAVHGIVAGIDVAGPGEDETVLTVRTGSQIIKHIGWFDSDPRGHVVHELMPYRERLEAVNVDSAGIGWNFYLHLRDLGFPAVPINVGEASNDSELYKNLKGELYWGLRKRFEENDVHGLPVEAIGQLSSIRYKHNARGQVEIESKEAAARRGVKSPDKAESIMLAFAPTKKTKLEFL